jgi:hypothetical protein
MGFVQKVGQYVIDSISEKYENAREGAKEYTDATVDSTWEELGEMDRERWESIRQDYTRDEAEEVREAHSYVENPTKFLKEHPDKAYTADRIADEIRQMDGGEEALQKVAQDTDESPEQYVQDRLRQNNAVLGTPDRQPDGENAVYYIINKEEAAEARDEPDDPGEGPDVNPYGGDTTGSGGGLGGTPDTTVGADDDDTADEPDDWRDRNDVDG